MRLPEIPHSWLIAMLIVSLMVLRTYGIDTYVTAGMSSLIGYLLGVKMEQVRK